MSQANPNRTGLTTEESRGGLSRGSKRLIFLTRDERLAVAWLEKGGFNSEFVRKEAESSRPHAFARKRTKRRIRKEREAFGYQIWLFDHASIQGNV